MSTGPRLLALLLASSFALMAGAQAPPATGAEKPVMVDGVVPDQATKAQILDKLRELYGAERVIDNIEVQQIATPPNWGRYVAGMLTPELRQVSEGKLEVNGQSVRISGKVVNEAQRQQVASGLSTASNRSYTVTNSLRSGGSPQTILDATLANRIIEFESGSARLTPKGEAILAEMADKMQSLGTMRLQIIGHTDNVGSRPSNIKLSAARAEAVKAYLQQQGVDGSRFGVAGRGPDEPVADNATPEGRARNRRIQFQVM